jgi:hypothetical protein
LLGEVRLWHPETGWGFISYPDFVDADQIENANHAGSVEGDR